MVSSLSNSAAILDNIDGKEEQEEHDDLQVYLPVVSFWNIIQINKVTVVPRKHKNLKSQIIYSHERKTCLKSKINNTVYV